MRLRINYFRSCSHAKRPELLSWAGRRLQVTHNHALALPGWIPSDQSGPAKKNPALQNIFRFSFGSYHQRASAFQLTPSLPFTCAPLPAVDADYTYAHLKLPGFEEISSREIPSTSCFAPTRKIRDSVTILALWLETKKVGFLLKIP